MVANTFTGFFRGAVIDNTAAGAVMTSWSHVNKLVFNKNSLYTVEGSVEFHGLEAVGIDTCEIMHNYITGKTTMFSAAALVVSNCKAVTLTANSFSTIGDFPSANYKTSAIQMWSFHDWTVTARFNKFYTNTKGGMHIMTGVYTGHALEGKAFKFPSGTVEYNRFNTGMSNYAIAVSDLWRTQSGSSTTHEGAIKADSSFMTAG